MKLFYRLVSDIFLLISPIIIMYRILKNKESASRFYERYAISTKTRVSGKLIWFHCVSVGELLSIVPMLEKFNNNPNVNQILITTTTLSSSKIFQRLKLKKIVHQFFPIDNYFIINKFLNYWKPSVLFLCESEIWPNLIYKMHQKKIKLVLLNARMTSKTFNKWKKFKSFSNSIFRKFDKSFAQNQETKNRLFLLGVRKVFSLGNLKFTTSKKTINEKLENKILNYFKSKTILMTAASTHFNEENFVIENHLYFKNKKQMKNSISIIVPRHIERVDQIKEEIEKFSLNVHLHSSEKKINKDVDIYIVDTYGDLNKFYKISNVVFLGGSLINHGGQNPLEPAKFGCKIINGPNIGNFTEIYSKLNKMGISNTFKTYKHGSKIVEKLLKTKKLQNKNKKIMKYGKRILNQTYSNISNFI